MSDEQMISAVGATSHDADADGWRRCAVGQHMTQYCGMAEKARAQERDAALNEVERLRAEVERLRANGQGMLDTSRPSDEDIWREIFLQCISDYITTDRRVIVADTLLAEYRKRWPK